MNLPTIAIIGRPNVGKSTLFNALVGERIAVIAEEAGTTRDRISQKVETKVMDFFLVDTGGIVFEKPDQSIENDMRKQAEIAIEESDVILLMLSYKDTILENDLPLVQLLRKRKKKNPLLVVVNKCDPPIDPNEMARYYRLGLGDPISISATHRHGFEILLKRITEECEKLHFLKKTDERYQLLLKEEESMPQIAIVGKPNVGKSSLVNAWLNKNRVIVSDIPGTTRDAIDTPIQIQKRKYNLIDTAGLKKAGHIAQGIEKFSTLRTLAAIDRCDVAAMVIDTSETVSHQDLAIVHMILEAKKGLMLLLNKWDLKEDEDPKEEERQKQFLEKLQGRFAFTPWAPTVFTSAMTKKNMNRVFDIIDRIQGERVKRVETNKLNQFLRDIMGKHLPSGTKRVFPKIYYVTQVGIKPPHFIFFVNKKNYFHFSYLRYLENRLRETFGFVGTTIDIEFREKPMRETTSHRPSKRLK